MFEFAALTNIEDEACLRAILCQSFRLPSEYWGTYVMRIGRENFRVVKDKGRLVGGLAVYRMGQWFGGRCLPLAGIAAVGIAPEHRAAGAAAHLMKSTLQELYEQGVPLSALYASTQRPYRKVGYEQAGSRTLYKLRLDSIGLKQRSTSVQRIDSAELEIYYELARARARTSNGNLERNPGMWERIVSYPYGDKTVYRYLIGSPHKPEGYLFFYQDAAELGPYDIYVRDMVALSPAAAGTLWTMLADHRSLAKHVLWAGPAVEPLLIVPTELEAEVIDPTRWMLRVVDVRKAFAGRGYPPGVEGELHFEIHDDVVPANHGRFILTVADGSGQVRAGGRGDLRAPIRGVAPLFSGFVPPGQLRVLGQIEADDQAIDLATLVFAGPPPWMPDMF